MRRRLLLSAGNPVARIRNSFKDRIAADLGIFEAESCLDTEITRLRNLGLYDKASLILTPNGYKASKMYSLLPNSGSGDLTFTRASTSMRRNISGIWESVANNVPRLNFPVNGGCPSLLQEPQRTNVVPRSSPTAATWTSSGGASLANEIILTPIASVTSALKVTTVASAFSGAYVAQAGASADYTAWAFVKKGTLNFASLFNAEASINAAWFNIDNCTLGTVAVGYTAGIEDAGNGWYLIWVNKNTNEIAQFFQIMFTNTDASSVGAVGHSFICHAQTEVGANPTSPIITAGSAITRVGDLPTLTGASALVGQTEGTLYWEGSCQLQTDLVGINQSTVNGLYITKGSGSLYRATIYANSVPIGFADVGIKNTKVKIALSYKSGDSALFVNGAKIGATNTTLFTFTGALSAIRLNDNYLIGTQPQLVDEVIITPTRLTDAECITLTTL